MFKSRDLRERELDIAGISLSPCNLNVFSPILLIRPLYFNSFRSVYLFYIPKNSNISVHLAAHPQPAINFPARKDRISFS